MNISFFDNRFDKIPKNKQISWEEFAKFFVFPERLNISTQEFHGMTKEKQSEYKDCGAYLGGLALNSRNKNDVLRRSIINLDLDDNPDIAKIISLLKRKGLSYIIHTTAKHKPDAARIRILFPLKEEISIDVERKNQLVSRVIGDLVGIDDIDPTTFDVNRLNFFPVSPSDGHYDYWIGDGKAIDAELIVEQVQKETGDWTNETFWPRHVKESIPVTQRAERLGDPRNKPGLIGIFCRKYNIHEAIETYLQDIYEPSLNCKRYTYKDGSSQNGLIIYDEGQYCFNRHSTNPIGIKHCYNAYDLVRIHLFGELDKDSHGNTKVENLPSTMAMNEMIKIDKGEISNIDIKDPESWKVFLDYDNKGKL